MSKLLVILGFLSSSAFAQRVLHYEFEGTLADSSGTQGAATAVGSVGYTSAGVTVGSAAATLTGADGTYISLAQQINFSGTDLWSVTFWAQRGELGGHKGMVAGKLDTANDFIWLNDNYTGFRFRNSSGSTIDFNTPKDMLLHHYLLVADCTGRMTLYLDGGAATNQTGKTRLSFPKSL